MSPSDATFPYMVLVTVTVCSRPNDVHPELVPFHVLPNEPRDPQLASYAVMVPNGCDGGSHEKVTEVAVEVEEMFLTSVGLAPA
jgi:hypothetical protein